jgi:hypothetical protein
LWAANILPNGQKIARNRPGLLAFASDRPVRCVIFDRDQMPAGGAPAAKFLIKSKFWKRTGVHTD